MRLPAIELVLALCWAAAASAADTGDPPYTTDVWRPEIRLLKALRTHDSHSLKASLATGFVFVGPRGPIGGDAGANAMQRQFDQIPTDAHFNLGTLPVPIVHGVAKLARTATTPQVDRKSTEYRCEDSWREIGKEWKLAAVHVLSARTVVDPQHVPDNPAVRTELEKAYADYFTALEKKDAALFRRVTLPSYSSIIQVNERSYKKTGDPLADKMAALEPLGSMTAKFHKLFVQGDKAVAVVDQIATKHEQPDPKAPRGEFQITSWTIPEHVKDTWRRTPEGWKLEKEEAAGP